MQVDFPENPFEDFDTFFSWYLDTIEKNMPVPMSEVNASSITLRVIAKDCPNYLKSRRSLLMKKFACR